jgi:hypothetical protein
MIMLFGDKLSALVSLISPNFNLQPTLVSLGLAATPKSRMKLFYEKHNPEKVTNTPEQRGFASPEQRGFAFCVPFGPSYSYAT